MAIDAAILRELKALDEASGGGLIAELIGMFASATPERLAKLRASLAANDAKAVASEAHAMKGSAGAVGASLMLTLAGALEAEAKQGNLAEANARIAAMEAELPVVLGELEQENQRK